MRFNATLNVDFAQWRNVKMERENNMREYRGFDEDMPKFGAGSEYNRDQREEARRKKYGITARKYKAESQPWILKVGGKSGKKFRGIREGGVGANAAFYVFTHAPDGAIEAYPLNEWYNFQPIQRYKALSAEEAEQEFGRRNKVLNYFNLMCRKRLKADEEDGVDPEEANLKIPGAAKKGKELKISDMDEWIDSDDDSDSDESDGEGKTKKKEEENDEDAKNKKKNKKNQAEKKKKKDTDDEAFEESDDGDEEGRELDYISDSSDQESDPESKANKEMKSVAEEDALRKLLTSDEDSDDEKKSDDESNKDDEKTKKESKEKDAKDKKKKKLTKKVKDEKKESLSDFSSDSSDSENEKPTLKNKKLNGNSANNSRSASPSLAIIDGNSSSGQAVKRKLASMPTDLGSGGNSNGGSENSNSPSVTPAKRTKYDGPSTMPSSFSGVISSKE